MKGKIVQLVTQLEPAGAQSLASWLDRSIGESEDVETYFFYQKFPSDLFSGDRCLVSGRPSSLTNLIILFSKLRRILKFQATTVVAHTHYAIAIILLVALTVRRSRRPQLIAVHHWPLAKYPLIARLAISLSSAMGVSRDDVFVSDSLVKSPGAIVIPNPVQKQAVGSPESLVELENLLRDLPQLDLLVVARHSVEKDLATAVRALTQLPGRSITFVGEGPLSTDLKTLAAELGVGDRAYFVGRLSGASVRALMGRASTLLLPSLWEAMPMVLLEAAFEGCDMVVSDIPAHQFVLSEGAALGFKVGDAASLAAAIGGASSSENRATQSVGRLAICASLSESTILSKWLDLICSNESLRSNSATVSSDLES